MSEQDSGIHLMLSGRSISALAKSFDVSRSAMKAILMDILPNQETKYKNASIFSNAMLNQYSEAIQTQVDKIHKNKIKYGLPMKFIQGMQDKNADNIPDGVVFSRSDLSKLGGVSTQTVKRIEERFIQAKYFRYKIVDEIKIFVGYESDGIKQCIILCHELAEQYCDEEE
jgi:hypothetical protein